MKAARSRPPPPPPPSAAGAMGLAAALAAWPDEHPLPFMPFSDVVYRPDSAVFDGDGAMTAAAAADFAALCGAARSQLQYEDRYLSRCRLRDACIRFTCVARV